MGEKTEVQNGKLLAQVFKVGVDEPIQEKIRISKLLIGWLVLNLKG